MIRDAERPLTGPANPWQGEPQIKLGRRPVPEGYKYYGGERQGWHGQPAVTVDLNAARSGARVFEDPAALEAFAAELLTAANWLRTQQAEAP